MNIQELVKQITPLYNTYKSNAKEISGKEALKLMWDIGELLREFLSENDIQPHALYREIYGKSEGAENTSKKSYITREFLGRAYRIRLMFKSKSEIDEKFPNLKKFITFREAMPFFDNPKYAFKGSQMNDLLELLNKSDNRLVFKEIKKLQKKHIGVRNSRSQRLDDLAEEKTIFINFYNYVYSLLNGNNLNVKKELEAYGVTESLIKALSKDTSSLTDDGLLFTNYKYLEKVTDENWMNYINFIKDIRSKTNPKVIRRFRRIIPPIRMINLAEMLLKLIK